MHNISNLPNFIKNLSKPKSIIFFFYEGNDLEENSLEYSSLSKSNENLNGFVLRRINENINLNSKDKLTTLFPLFSITEDLYNHLNILLKKLIQSDENANKKSLIINRVKKLFGFTIVLDEEKDDKLIFNNSIKDNNYYRNISW